MKKLNQLFPLFLSLCVAVMLLSGCSGGKSGSDSGTTGANPPPAAGGAGASGDVIYDGNGAVYMAITAGLPAASPLTCRLWRNGWGFTPPMWS